MDFSHYSDLSVEIAVELVNTIDRISGEDQLADIDGLQTFLERFELDRQQEDWYVGALTDKDLGETVALRERLRTVFDAGDDREAADILNQILSQARAVPRISVHSGASPHLHFEPAKGRLAQWLGAATAMGLGVVLCDFGFERFGTCSAHDCVDAFVDTSRNCSRRHCSSSCTSRENVAAYRRRQRQGS